MLSMTEGDPAPGKFTKQVAPEYQDTQVYHVLYLPVDWKPGAQYPVIVEFSGNRYGTVCTGRPEGCKLGYYQSGGSGFIWVVMPFVDTTARDIALNWWGDVDATVAYCRNNLRRVCENYGGDPNSVFITGFSRGALACGYIGLQNDEIADIWLGFIPHSHHDGGTYYKEGSTERLARIAGRPTFITYGENDGGKANSLTGAELLRKLNFPVTAIEIPKLDHTDMWITQPCAERDAMRAWIAEMLKTRPGTAAVKGRVLDKNAKPAAKARVQSGWHWTFSDEKGEFILPGLTPGKRSLEVTKNGARFAPFSLTLTPTGASDLMIQAK